jgi:hypothetical protein
MMVGKRLLALAAMLIAALATASLYSQNRKPAANSVMARGAAFRILLGGGESEPASWDGAIEISPRRILLRMANTCTHASRERRR